MPEASIKLCKENGDECKVCTGPKCNSRSSFVKCLNCNSTDDRQCATNPESINSKFCENYDDQCFTYISRSHISRGCLIEKGHHYSPNGQFSTHCSKYPLKCGMCNTSDGNGCNNRTIIMEACVDCNSLVDSRCHEEPHLFKDKICSTLRMDDRPGCYLSVVGFYFKCVSLKDFCVINVLICFSTIICTDEDVLTMRLEKKTYATCK